MIFHWHQGEGHILLFYKKCHFCHLLPFATVGQKCDSKLLKFLFLYHTVFTGESTISTCRICWVDCGCDGDGGRGYVRWRDPLCLVGGRCHDTSHGRHGSNGGRGRRGVVVSWRGRLEARMGRRVVGMDFGLRTRIDWRRLGVTDHHRWRMPHLRIGAPRTTQHERYISLVFVWHIRHEN